MTSAIIWVVLAVILGGLGIYKARKDNRAGKTEQKLDQAEEVLDNVEKAKNTVLDLDAERAEQLRERYKRVRLLPRDPPGEPKND